VTGAAPEVIVVGAGPAGTAAAIRLRQHGVTVSVLERSMGPRARVGESVPADIRAPLAELGAWPAFCVQGHLESRGAASAWETPSLRRSDAWCSPLGGGWHLDRRAFESMLVQQAARAGAEIRAATTVVHIDTQGAGWRVHTVGATGRRDAMNARLLVDATGRPAIVSRRLGARRCLQDRLVCAHAVFSAGNGAAEPRTLVEAVEDGWWYATPLPGQRSLAAFFTDAGMLRTGNYGAAASWHRALRRAVHVFDYVGRPREPRDLRICAASQHCLDRSAGNGWIAVGDAASSLDPLSSAGLTLALRTGLNGGDAVCRHLAGDRDALNDHGSEVRRRFSGYLAQRAALYGLVQRWPDAPFWNRRPAYNGN